MVRQHFSRYPLECILAREFSALEINNHNNNLK